MTTRTAAWAPDELAAEVKPPIVLLPRSAQNTELAIEQFADLSRYVKRDVTGDHIDETFCNFFVRETLRAQGVEIPRARCNDLITFFQSSSDWDRVRPWVAQALTHAGFPVVVLWVNPTPSSSGHIARLKPRRAGDDPNGWYIAQAGSSNFTHDKLSKGFGDLKPLHFFAHP
jgi:acetylornithine deacetylase/succinyl-diaminopimelate desuccinylase-like protein